MKACSWVRNVNVRVAGLAHREPILLAHNCCRFVLAHLAQPNALMNYGHTIIAQVKLEVASLAQEGLVVTAKHRRGLLTTSVARPRHGPRTLKRQLARRSRHRASPPVSMHGIFTPESRTEMPHYVVIDIIPGHTSNEKFSGFLRKFREIHQFIQAD